MAYNENAVKQEYIEKQNKLEDFVRSVLSAQVLGSDWKINTDEVRNIISVSQVIISRNSEYGLDKICFNYAHNSREQRVSITTYQIEALKGWYPSYNDTKALQAPSCTVAIDREPAQVAKSIVSKIIPIMEQRNKNAFDKKKDWDNTDKDAQSVSDAIIKAGSGYLKYWEKPIPGKPTNSYKVSSVSSYQLPDEPKGIEISLNADCSPSRVNLEINTLSTEMAQSIIAYYIELKKIQKEKQDAER